MTTAALTDELTLEHFSKWLEGQVAFGVAMHTDTDFFGRYLDTYPRQLPDAQLMRLMKRSPVLTSAAELRKAISYAKGRS